MSNQLPSRRQVLASATAVAATIGFSRTATAADTDESKWVTQLASFSIQGGKEEEAVAALEKLTKAVEENEPGVLAYVVYRELENPLNLTFFEIYDSPESLKAHGGQPHLRKMFGSFTKLFQGPVKVTKLGKVGGFMRPMS